MDRTPSDSSNFSIEEPVSGDSAQVVSVNTGDSGGNFRSGNLSAEVEELVSDGLSDVVSSLVLKELVV